MQFICPKCGKPASASPLVWVGYNHGFEHIDVQGWLPWKLKYKLSCICFDKSHNLFGCPFDVYLTKEQATEFEDECKKRDEIPVGRVEEDTTSKW
jgi:hypothetical protein